MFLWGVTLNSLFGMSLWNVFLRGVCLSVWSVEAAAAPNAAATVIPTSGVITPTAKKQIRLEHDRYILHILQAVQHDTTGRRSLGQAFVQAWSTTAVVSASRIMACCLASKQRATRSFRQRNGPLVLVRGAA